MWNQSIAGDFPGGWRRLEAGCCFCGGIAEVQGSYKNAGLIVPASRLGWLDRGGIATGSSARTGCSRFYDSTGDCWFRVREHRGGLQGGENAGEGDFWARGDRRGSSRADWRVWRCDPPNPCSYRGSRAALLVYFRLMFAFYNENYAILSLLWLRLDWMNVPRPCQLFGRPPFEQCSMTLQAQSLGPCMARRSRTFSAGWIHAVIPLSLKRHAGTI